MKKNKNLINLKYNKHNFYHNEWYTNAYYFNKYMNIHENIFIKNIYSILNVFFNKKSIVGNTIYNGLFNKIYFIISDLKHYSNKIVINIYVYNRQKIFILRKLKFLIVNKNTYYINNKNMSLKEKLININNKLYLYRYYASILYINNISFSSYNLVNIKEIFYNIFSKKIQFNITNVKYIHLNNNILLESLTKKLNKNRKIPVLRLIRKILTYAKVAKLHSILKVNKLSKYISDKITGNYSDILKFKYLKKLHKSIFFNSANMHVVGLKLEARGRLTKRLVAARTIKKIKYKGSLNNIYSSINENSTILFKGFERSNINYKNANKHNLLGSYSIKYWVSSY
jgi:hypothetical protein